MASKAGTLEILAQQIVLALQPLETQLTAANIIPFLAELGLQFPPQLTSQASFMNAVTAGSTAAGKLGTLLTQLATDIENDDEGAILTDGLTIITAIAAI